MINCKFDGAREGRLRCAVSPHKEKDIKFRDTQISR
jgi:hypothetical protein